MKECVVDNGYIKEANEFGLYKMSLPICITLEYWIKQDLVDLNEIKLQSAIDARIQWGENATSPYYFEKPNILWG